MRIRRDRGLTPVELIVVILAVGIVASVTIPAILRGHRNDFLARCEANLRALGKAEADLRARGGPLPTARGHAYWTAIAPDPALLVCPLSHLPYRGPADDPSLIPAGAPLGADAFDSHGPGEGGNVLLNTGNVHAFRERDGYWKEAAKYLKP